MNFCILIPCYNHPTTVSEVVGAAQKFAPMIVIDDDSTLPLPELPSCEIFRLAQNSGKGAALRAGFERARELNFTHAIVMDADGQHFAEDLPKFFDAAQKNPTALIVGVRDFFAAGCPTHRRRSNAISSFWFWAESGIRLPDTQCGFRCYPLALTKSLQIKYGRYAFELEFMVRAAWVGTQIVAVPVKSSYEPHQIRQSHFRPVADFIHITRMNVRLVLQSWFVPRSLRTEWSFGISTTRRHTLYEIFSEHAHEPLQLALAIGLGLFFGIVPIWGIQMATVAVVAHKLRLNKAIALIASNISLGPGAIIITGGAIVLGHWIFTGRRLPFPPPMDFSKTGEYLSQWLVGSFALAIIVAIFGTIAAYILARLVKRK
jgi:glycosyltransferase involved in cell wall biosynthesis